MYVSSQMQTWSVMRCLRGELLDNLKLSVKIPRTFLCPARSKHLPPKKVSQMFVVFGSKMPEISELSSKSHQLFLFNSIMYPCHPGGFHLLPLGQRVLEKVIKIVDQEMEVIGAQKLSMTTLAPKALWSQTGRWNNTGAELLKLQDRHKRKYCLGPTHEELITDMVKKLKFLKRAYPLLVYQITRKFRDESHPRYGLLRGREFEMKDLYSFDLSLEKAKETYETVCKAYEGIFKRLNLDVIKAEASVGNIGGSLSHEFHLEASVGEDTVYRCLQCGHTANAEVSGMDDKNEPVCSHCRSNNLHKLSCIEVGHSFLLGEKYSRVFDAIYTHRDGTKSFLDMGCFGLGVTRLIQAVVEVLSTQTHIKWPRIIAPYQVCVIPQKEGYMFEEFFKDAKRLATELNNMAELKGEVILEDRIQKSIGQRLWDIKNLGIPFAVIVSRQEGDAKLYELQDIYNDEIYILSEIQLRETLKTIVKTV